MRNVILRYLSIGVAAAAMSLLGCGTSTTGVNGSGSGSGSGSSGTPPTDTVAPEFPDNSGQVEKTELAYPPAPWGYKKGTVIKNYKFIGFANAAVVNNAMQAIELAQFYNPHADDQNYHPASPEVDDRLFPPGSPYGAGTPKPKALEIDAAAVWCGPCNQEAKSELPGRYAKYKPIGGEFLLLLTDGPTVGVPATSKNLYNWTKKYAVNFPGVISPDLELAEVFSDNAFPSNIIVNTRTMMIVEAIAGVPDAAYWTKFEKTIAGN